MGHGDFKNEALSHAFSYTEKIMNRNLEKTFSLFFAIFVFLQFTMYKIRKYPIRKDNFFYARIG
jgi:uncharacterized membrane protein